MPKPQAFHADARGIRLLLQEQRYRRHFLVADAKLSVAVLGTVCLANLAFSRNDYALGGATPTFFAQLAVRLSATLVGILSIVVLLRAKRPAQHDGALVCALSAIAATSGFVIHSRVASGEYVGPIIAQFAVLVVVFFAFRGPLWPRLIPALGVALTLLIHVYDPHLSISKLARNTTTIVLVALSLVGIFASRSYENERRKRFEAERHEKCMRRELEIKMRELAAEKERAVALSQARTTFLAAMSHEFRTPMNAVIGLSDLLVGAPLAAEHRDQVRTIRDSARALLELLNEILDFTKIEADKLVLSPSAFDVRALVGSVFDMLQPEAAKRAILLRLHVAPAVPDGLSADHVRLRQVLVNLLSNAVKFTKDGEVALHIEASEASEGEHAISFRVVDTGIGIPEDALRRLFRPFEQADHGITRHYGGTGLGLAISQKLVHAMGGDIHVESEPGRGSVFSFSVTLPEADPPRASLAPPEMRHQRRSLAILLVDDNPLNRRVALAVLDRLGYDADVAEGGPAALEAVAQKTYDVVLMDLQMPGMTGIEATQQIAQLPGRRKPRVIAMTASVFEEDRAACRAAGMIDFVGKPIDARELDGVLTRAALSPDEHDTASPLGKGALDMLRELERLGEPGFVATLCREFLVDTHDRLLRMRRAAEQGAAGELERDAHSLKSASATVGANEFSRLAASLEFAARSGTLADAEGLLESLSCEFVRVDRALRLEIGDRPSGELLATG